MKDGENSMLSYGGKAPSLAATGTTLTFGGHAFGVIGLIVGAVALVAMGALMLRLGWRRDRALNAR